MYVVEIEARVSKISALAGPIESANIPRTINMIEKVTLPNSELREDMVAR
mgnify:CR=1 FL=1